MEDNKEPTIETTNPEKCVFVSGIPYTTTEEELRQFFEKCGEIKQIKLPRYQDSGKLRGYAHVYFNKRRSVKKVK